MTEQNSKQEETQSGKQVVMGIIAFIVGLIVLVALAKLVMG
jgi:hypothetical protein